MMVELAGRVSPQHPCLSCGSETKETREIGWRICSSDRCRDKSFSITSEEVRGLVDLIGDLKSRAERAETQMVQSRAEAASARERVRELTVAYGQARDELIQVRGH